MLILLLAVVLRLYRLGAEGFWLDEVISITQPQWSLGDVMVRFWSLEGGGRDFSLLPLSIAKRFGTSEFALRLPYAVFSVLDVAALYLVARRLAGLATARVAMVFLALSPMHVWYAQEVRWYSLWSLVATLSFLALVEARRSERPGPWLAYLAAMALSFYTFVLSVFVAATHVASTWLFALLGGGRRQFVRQHVVLGVASLISLPVIAIALGMNPSEGQVGDVVGTPRSRSLIELPYVFFTYVVGFTLGPTVRELHRIRDPGWIFGNFPEIFAFAAIVGTLFILGLQRLRGDGRVASVLIPWALGLPVLLFAVSMVTGQTFNVRYALPGLTGFVILLAMGTQSFERSAARYAAAALVMVIFSISLASFYWNPRYDKEHIREAVAVIERDEHAGAPMGFVGQGDLVAEYYGPGLDVRHPLECAMSGEGASGQPTETLRGEPIVWLMVARDWTDTVDPCLEELRNSHRVALHEEFIGVELWRFEAPDLAR